METWVWLIIGLAVGIGVGAIGALLIRKNTGSQRSIADLKKENEQFREEVSGHFVETARLINRMTDSYKDVFDHLSRGAETLVDDKSLRERMPLVSGREVRLKHLGTQAGGGAQADDSSSGIEKPPAGRSGKNSSVADSSVPVSPASKTSTPKPAASGAPDRATVGAKPSGSAEKESADKKSSDAKSSGSKPASAPGEPTDPLKSAGTRANDQAGTAAGGDQPRSSVATPGKSSSTSKSASSPSGSKSGG